MLFYLFLAYEISNRWLWTRLLLSTNKKLSGTFSGNSFLMIVVYISSDNDYSNGCHLGSRYFIGNYSNPLAFLFFFLFFFLFALNSFDLGRWGNWGKEKVHHLLRSFCQAQTQGQVTISTELFLQCNIGEVCSMQGETGEMHALGSTLSRECVWWLRRALNKVAMTMGSSQSPSGTNKTFAVRAMLCISLSNIGTMSHM